MKKFRAVKYWMPIFLAIAFVLGILGGIWIDRGRFTLTPGQQKLNELLAIIDAYYVDTVNVDSVIEKSLPSLLGTLDPHSVYVAAAEREEVNSELEGSFAGVGIQFQINNDTVSVVEVIANGPSEKAGVMAGDKIITVDGKPLKVKENGGDEEVRNKLRGPKGTKVEIEVLRNHSRKPLKFTITRGDIPMNSVDASYMANPETGYVKVSRFARNTYREFLTALTELHHAGARDYIIDLRGNTGGFMETAILMVNEFLPGGKVIVATHGRNVENDEVILSDGTGAFQHARVVVLIDEMSASSSEIFAGALQDNDRGLILGRRSFVYSFIYIQSLMAVFCFAYATPKRPGFPLRFAVSFLGGGAVCVLLRWLHRLFPSLPSGPIRFVTLELVYVLLILAVYWMFDESIWSAMFIASSGYALQNISGCCKSLLRLIPPVGDLSNQVGGRISLEIFCLAATSAVLFFVFRPYSRKRNENIDNKYKALFSVFILLLCIGMGRITQDNSGRNDVAVLAENTYSIMTCVLTLVLQFGVIENTALTRNVDTMQELLHQQYTQYNTSKESAQLLNEKYHDMKQMLRTFEGEIPRQRLQALEQTIEGYDNSVKTGNEALDVLLTEKRAICQSSGIAFTCFAGGVDLSFMDKLDLYSLLSNALNNAIEAVRRLPEDRERFIILTARREGEMVTFHIENPSEEDIPFKDGLPQSRRDPRFHGFGMKSMERIAGQYNGAVAAKLASGMFYLDVLLFAETGTGAV